MIVLPPQSAKILGNVVNSKMSLPRTDHNLRNGTTSKLMRPTFLRSLEAKRSQNLPKHALINDNAVMITLYRRYNPLSKFLNDLSSY